MHHGKTEQDDMSYLVEPRGPGKSWVFRMIKPPVLVDVPNPWGAKPLGKAIRKGLGTSPRPASSATSRRAVYTL